MKTKIIELYKKIANKDDPSNKQISVKSKSITSDWQNIVKSLFKKIGIKVSNTTVNIITIGSLVGLAVPIYFVVNDLGNTEIEDDLGNTDENARKGEVIVTESGLQYEIISQGNGSQRPNPTDTVKVHYHGTLIDGTVFDSSLVRGEPIEFPVNGVIPGWTEALQLMVVGDIWKLTIPSNLAYGTNGAGGVIPPNSTLIFEVRLLAISKNKQ
jgi:hypothetical protein